ncbi:hypothetical protein B0H13DRAFT_1660852 [Mycena leptocephala]|nr:hypothetical protein B0H13DRAFT_1660852 [Mycena leptocephala]
MALDQQYFAAGVRTTGCAEGENRINKMIGSLEKTILQLFNGLNDRSEDQTTNDLIQLHQHARPYALQICYKQMQLSLFYETEVVQRRNEHMINTFENDNAHVSIRWLIQQVSQRGLEVRHLLRVRHTATGTLHYMAVLPDGRYICNCCMPSNLGIPCRHYFRIWIDVEGLPFHISLISQRYDFRVYHEH